MKKTTSAPMDEGRIKALISLLDDDDKEVFEQIREQLLSLGKPVIPLLESAWCSAFDAVLQQRIEDIIHKIQFESLVEELKEWSLYENDNLLKGVILIARFQYPDLNEEKIKSQLHQLKREIWMELNDNLTALEQAQIFNLVLYQKHNYMGNTSNFHAPQNSYINNVLESEKGNPLMLSIIYALLAQQLDLPIYGVNLPEHFILAYMNASKDKITGEFPASSAPLFYINPFSKGAVFDKKDIDAFLVKLNLEPHPSFFQPCSNLEIIKRLIRNLCYSYEKSGYVDKLEELQRLLKSLDEREFA